MAESSFFKNFEVTKPNAEAFTEMMTQPVDPNIRKWLKTPYKNPANNKKLLHELDQAMNNDN